MKAAAHNYPGVLAPYWDDIFKVLVRVIDSGTFEGQSGASDDGYLFSTAYAKNISSGLVQGSRLSDEELVRSAIEVCTLISNLVSCSSFNTNNLMLIFSLLLDIHVIFFNLVVTTLTNPSCVLIRSILLIFTHIFF